MSVLIVVNCSKVYVFHKYNVDTSVLFRKDCNCLPVFNSQPYILAKEFFLLPIFLKKVPDFAIVLLIDVLFQG